MPTTDPAVTKAVDALVRLTPAPFLFFHMPSMPPRVGTWL